MPNALPALDSDPDHWGPEHDQLQLTEEEILEGLRHGRLIQPDDDTDNGMDL